MSLVTQVPSVVLSPEPPALGIIDFTAQVTLYDPDGTASSMRFFEGLYICAIYARRNRACALYTPDGSALVLEHLDGMVKGAPAVLDALTGLLEVLAKECEKEREMAAGSSLDEQQHSTASRELPPEQLHNSRTREQGANRFRRNHR